MTNYLWTLESWGDAQPPENADEIIAAANDMITHYAETNGEEEARNYSEELWDRYCTTGSLDLVLGNDNETLMELTNHESGILVYGNTSVIVTNWMSYGENEMPILSPIGTLMSWPEEDGVFHGARRRWVRDIRTEIPGSIWLTGETADDGTRLADTDLDIVSDVHNDLIRLFLEDLTADDYEGYVYILRDGRKVISPTMWN